MANKDKDFLVFYDWYVILKDMSAANFKLVLCSMIEYQINGAEPPEFPKNIRAVCSMLFSQLERRKVNMANGKRGGIASAKAILEKNIAESAAMSPDERLYSALARASLRHKDQD